MSVARTITCYVNSNIIQRMTSSDARMLAGYFGEHNATKISFVLTGSVWDGLLKHVDIISPKGTELSPIFLDNTNSLLLPALALNADGKLKFTLTGSELNEETQTLTMRVKTGVSILPVLEAIDGGDIDPTEEIQGYLESILNTINLATATNDELEAAEALRVISENLRISGESARIDAESARASVEALRVLAENGRVDAELARDLAEAARDLAEQGRAGAEADRVSAENDRVIAEAARVIAEQDRVDAESDRDIFYNEMKAVTGIIYSDGEGNLHTAEHLHIQSVAASTWTITHNRNTYPSVTVIDSAGNTVVGDVSYIDGNQLSISFNGSFTGKAYVI